MQDSNINTAIDNRRVYNLVAYFFFLNVSIISFLNKSILFQKIFVFYYRSQLIMNNSG